MSIHITFPLTFVQSECNMFYPCTIISNHFSRQSAFNGLNILLIWVRVPHLLPVSSQYTTCTAHVTISHYLVHPKYYLSCQWSVRTLPLLPMSSQDTTSFIEGQSVHRLPCPCPECQYSTAHIQSVNHLFIIIYMAILILHSPSQNTTSSAQVQTVHHPSFSGPVKVLHLFS